MSKNLKLFSVAGMLIFTPLLCHKCDHMADFEFFERYYNYISLSCKFQLKSIALLRNCSIFPFSYVFLYFVEILSMCLGKN